MQNDLVWVADSLGGVIRKAREQKGMTQKQLADRCGGISSMYVSQIENGDRVPAVRISRLLAKSLDLDERQLLLLVYREKAPEEIRDLLMKEDRTGKEDHIEYKFRKLLKLVNTLPPDKKNRLARLWEDALKLLIE